MLKGGYEQQMRKGVLEIVILKLVAQKPTYGYELITALREKSNGAVALKDGTLYPILYRLEDDGLLESRWIQQTGRAKPKKIYSATDAGRQALEQLCALWAGFSSFVNEVLKEEEA